MADESDRLIETISPVERGVREMGNRLSILRGLTPFLVIKIFSHLMRERLRVRGTHPVRPEPVEGSPKSGC
jgi:hypothetical protein